jgi:sugar (pentulose or hexulose) kinase
MTFLLNRLARVTSLLTLAAMLGACGGGDVSSSSANSAQPANRCSSHYVRLPGQSTRPNASAFPECTFLNTSAETYLAAAINACVEGNILAADDHYSRYRQVVKTPCPS